jgi:cytochrome b561
MTVAANRYTRTTVVLHWVLAAALLCQVVLGWWMLDLPKTPPGLRAGWFNWHKSTGLLIGVAALIRLSWRAAHPVPGHSGLPAWQRRAAQFNHGLLYLCMLVLPLSGYLGSNFSGYPIRFFGMALKPWSQAWPAGKEFMSTLHYAGVWLFMALAALHIAAALWHWWRRHDVALRMLPRLSRT